MIEIRVDVARIGEPRADIADIAAAADEIGTPGEPGRRRSGIPANRNCRRFMCSLLICNQVYGF